METVSVMLRRSLLVLILAFAAAAAFAAAEDPLAVNEPVEIEITAIDSDGFNEQITKDEDGLQVWLVTGGVRIALPRRRSMHARNMVIWPLSNDDGDIVGAQVYAEGNVRFEGPDAYLEADRMFYDHATGRVILLEAEVRVELERENLPLVFRAGKIRGCVADGTYEAEKGYITTCLFGLPHYRLQASNITFTSTEDEAGRKSALVVSRNNALYLNRTPVLWWPRFSRDVKRLHTPLRHVEVGDSDEFGTFVRTRWDILDLLSGGSEDSWSARISRWGDLTGELDYLSDRGTGTGVNFDYEIGDTTGTLLGYYIRDRGTDSSGFVPPRDDRGRAKWRQRTFLHGVQIDTEVSYISDRGFLPEYYERESKEAKERETYVFIKKPWEKAQASLLYRARINDFQSQTEYLPEARLDAVAVPLGGGRLLYSSATRAGNIRFAPDDALALPHYQTRRVDSLHLFEIPLAAPGVVNVAPFATVRGTWYEDAADSESATRYVASWGAKVGLPPVWKVYDVDSSLFDIHGMRHVAMLDFTYENTYDATETPTDLLQFDEVDGADTLELATIRLKQRLQTKRASGEEGAPNRTVDLISFETEADYFPNAARDNAGNEWSDLRFHGRANITDDVSILAGADYDTYNGRFDKSGVWLRVDHGPRTSWGVGSRHVRALSSSAMTMQFAHEITDRWSVLLLGQYDFNEGAITDETVVLRRSLDQFVLEVALDYDKGRGSTSLALRIYPSGTRGSRSSY